MLSRRELLKHTGQVGLAMACTPMSRFMSRSGKNRCINVVNFIRGVEPRFPTDLLLPVQKQMELILQHRLPATWLLQFDALVSGPFVGFLKEHIAKNHEVGFWFEMNEMHCKAAGVEWRGRPGFEWDHLPPVAFTIGYTPDERIKLADAAMKQFGGIWGYYPKSVASWNLDSITMAHLVDRYKVEAFAVCRDQIATDGFTIWGAPIAGYYPSKANCWSPAVARKDQIAAPVFRMLGQDPVYYYYRHYPLPDGKTVGQPDTMEPTWISGQSPRFVETFLHMISEGPCLQFAYAQLGQENSFPWPGISQGYPMQMEALAKLHDAGSVHVETMGESGRPFKREFKSTPMQAQVQLEDPFGNTPEEGSIWFQSRFYRANLHIKGDLPFLRDLTVYNDQNSQPFLRQATRSNDVEQRMPAVLDGYHWSPMPGSLGQPAAGGFFLANGERLRLDIPEGLSSPLKRRVLVSETPKGLTVSMAIKGGNLRAEFEERTIAFSLLSSSGSLSLAFEWDPSKAALTGVEPSRALYRWQGLDYSVRVAGGEASQTLKGWTAKQSSERLVLYMTQGS